MLEIGEGLPHVYPIMLGTPEAAEATEQIGTFLRARVKVPRGARVLPSGSGQESGLEAS